MREELAGPVYAVFRSGLDLKERLEHSSELLDFEKEQSALKDAVRKVPNVGEEGSAGREKFLGIRYPLVCWLDEIFIDEESRWKEQWREDSLETALYDIRDRAWNFWEQAEMAESRGSIDALEVFYLCVMLGFRGDSRNDMRRLKGWQQTTKTLVFSNQSSRWVEPEGPPPRTWVPPMTGSRRRQNMLMAWALSLLILIPLAIGFTVFRLATN